MTTPLRRVQRSAWALLYATGTTAAEVAETVHAAAGAIAADLADGVSRTTAWTAAAWRSV